MPNQSIKSLGYSLEKQVQDLATDMGLKVKRQPASGRFKAHEGDLVIEDTLAECKVRTLWTDAQGKQTLRIDLGWLDKVRVEAWQQELDEAVVLVRPKGSRKQVLAVMDASFFLRLLSRYRVSDPQTLTPDGDIG